MAKYYYNNQCMHVFVWNATWGVTVKSSPCVFRQMQYWNYEVIQLQLLYMCMITNLRDVGCYSNAAVNNFTSCKALQTLNVCYVAAKQHGSKQQ